MTLAARIDPLEDQDVEKPDNFLPIHCHVAHLVHALTNLKFPLRTCFVSECDAPVLNRTSFVSNYFL